MPQLDSDTFTYSDGNLATVSSGKWTKLSGMADCVVVSNAIRGTGADSVDVITSWSGSTGDQWSQATLVTTNGDDGGPTVRSDATSTFYGVHSAGATGWGIYRVLTGGFTRIAGYSGSADNSDVAYLEIQSTTLIMKEGGSGGTTVLTITDSNIASGKPGMWMFSTGSRYDLWSAGDFSGGGASPVALSTLTLMGVQ